MIVRIKMLGLCMLLISLAVVGCGRESAENHSIDQTSPRSSVMSLYQAINDGNLQAMKTLLDPDDDANQKALNGFQKALADGIQFEITEVLIDVAEETDEFARIQTTARQVVRHNGEIRSNSTTGDYLSLIKKDNKWYFIGFGQWPPPGWIVEPSNLTPAP
ncbi:MAG: hypothetical protein WBD79_27430 [Anaerolineae bacterium]